MNWDAAQIADVAEGPRSLHAARRVPRDRRSSRSTGPSAPKSPFSPKRDEFGASFTYAQQPELLERAFELASTFNTDRIRIFDFWRLEDQKPHRKAIDEVVRAAAVKAGARGLTLVLENEYACNTATGAEAARLLTAIPEKALQLTWDPGNAQFRDEVPFPGGYAALPKERIGHVHCKDAVRRADGKVGVDGDGARRHRLGGAVPRAEARRLPPRVHARNALARRRHAGGIEPPELCRHEGAARESRDRLTARWRFTSG